MCRCRGHGRMLLWGRERCWSSPVGGEGSGGTAGGDLLWKKVSRGSLKVSKLKSCLRKGHGCSVPCCRMEVVSLGTWHGLFWTWMEQTRGSASAFERGMARGQDGAGDLSIALAKTMGMLLQSAYWV